MEITGTAESYQPAPSTAASKTDTPVLLTPQSLQVVPRAVLNDQKALTLTDAIRNVAGVSPVAPRNVVVNRLCVPSPQAPATSASGSVDSRRSFSARAIRAFSTYTRGVVPTEILNARAKWNSLSAARAAKDFKRADTLRDQLLAAGYKILDTKSGSHLEKV